MEEIKQDLEKMKEAPINVTGEDKKHDIMIEQVRKTKKNEPKIFPFIVMIDKQAFADLMDHRTSVLK